MTPSILLSEIQEQPAVIRRLIDQEMDHVAEIAHSIQGRFNYILIAARGTSDNAARYAQYLFGCQNQIQVALATPSLFTLYNSRTNLEGALVIGISQSGQSPDINAVLIEARAQGCPTIAIVNKADSPLGLNAEYTIPLHAEPETAVAATKSYTASLVALAMLSSAMLPGNPLIPELKMVPDFMQACLDTSLAAAEKVQRYRYMGHCAVIGRGLNYSTGFEVALKVKELTRVVAEPYSSADFRHGPIATVGSGFPVIVVAPHGAAHADIADLAQRLHQLGAEMIIISDDDELLKMAHLALPIPKGMPEWITPMVAILPGQVFAMTLAVARGLNPDQPEGLMKVTETL